MSRLAVEYLTRSRNMLLTTREERERKRGGERDIGGYLYTEAERDK
jgi:hypothetical protein